MESKIYLALDDTRGLKEISERVNFPVPFNCFSLVKDYASFVEFITNNGVPNFVTFDFDLTLESMREYIKALNEGRVYERNNVKSKTGLDCIEFLISYCRENKVKFPEYAVHSANHFGAEWIKNAAEQYKFFEKHGQIYRKTV